MNAGKTLFAQLMDFLPWTTFDRYVKRYGGDKGVRSIQNITLGTSLGGGTVSLTYSDAAGIDLTAGQVTLLFANPEKSGWDATVCLVVGECEAARSDLLAPGEQVTQLPLLDGAEKDLTAGSCSGTLKVSFYHPQTGAKAMLDAEIPVTVTVTG